MQNEVTAQGFTGVSSLACHWRTQQETMVDVSMTPCLLYINPEGIDKKLLNSIKSRVLNGPSDDDDHNSDDVHMEYVTLPYHDLLAKARGISDLDAGCFYILNKDSADKGAVLCVEVKCYPDVKGMTYRFPSAATSRKFYLHPEIASVMAVHIKHGLGGLHVWLWTEER